MFVLVVSVFDIVSYSECKLILIALLFIWNCVL